MGAKKNFTWLFLWWGCCISSASDYLVVYWWRGWCLVRVRVWFGVWFWYGVKGLLFVGLVGSAVFVGVDRVKDARFDWLMMVTMLLVVVMGLVW